MKSNWNIKQVDSLLFTRTMPTHVSSITGDVLRILNARGYTDVESIVNFIYPEIMYHYSPYEMADMHEAVSRIRTAIDNNERIAIFADSDLDGITSLISVYTLLTRCNLKPYIRYLRNNEQYGLSKEIIDEFIAENISLLITVDSGTRDINEINYARKFGIDTIVTDHHEPDSVLPDAIVINPKRKDCSYPFKQLAGVGVVYKFCCAVLMSYMPSFNKNFKLIANKNNGVYVSTVCNGIILNELLYDSLEQFSGEYTFDNEEIHVFFDTDLFANMGSLPDNVFFIDTFIKKFSNGTIISKLYKNMFNIYGSMTRTEVINRFFIQLQIFSSEKIIHFIESIVQFVSIGSVADVMPLIDENRFLVKLGIDKLKNTTNIVFKKLFADNVNSKRISWAIAPLLNSPGRYGRTDLLVDLFLENNNDTIEKILNTIHALNEQRKEEIVSICNKILDDYRNGLINKHKRLLYLEQIDVPEGLLGLIANRLSDSFNKPVIITGMPDENGYVKGSGRCKDRTDLFSYFEKYAENFERIGGHPQAFGFTVGLEKLNDIITNIDNELSEETVIIPDVVEIDMELDVDRITPEFIDTLSVLEPYGNGNPEPVFFSRNIELVSFEKFGNGKHGKYCIAANNIVTIIGWNYADLMEEVFSKNKPVNMIYHLENDHFRGNVNPRMFMMDIEITG